MNRVGVQCTALTRKANKKLSQIGGTRSKRMHWMDARALRRKDAFRGERPWGDTVCDPWISDRETVIQAPWLVCALGLFKLSELKHLSS
ncbi:unnamed protein product [Ilex paraguariensis]|uniref:Uncharacterized protein n=1 Tax=Ilex paraguariensis TaxID=185542 RepID=A0ABC8UXC7_9AQUA